ncbi:DUF4179 domain-containing protein [Fusibacter ferrireducens]|uniref:DUF4179 domain-containing protein n=1 Tax=Fusibacter ferrireducens TaxID=2785058 RepID=A0ABR9ZRF0_9FIRM|nr:DUF4179 domain-containing protein [Fusibacter ferrireducens]MBF4693028.1 DUF4179 domain-containing protein [Fusibacter ferrireducens]
MKDIYELLNEAEIDLDEFEENSLDELYRKKIKRSVHGQIRRRKSLFIQGSKIAAVFLCIVFTATFISFKINPTFATSIPVVGSIIKDITGYGNDLFDQYTAVINKSSEKEGIKITLNEVMLDSNQLRIATTIESEKAYNETFYTTPPTVFVNGGMLRSYSSSGVGSYRDAHTLVDIATIDVHDVKIPSQINMKIVYENFSYQDNNGENKVIKGPWVFDFAISKAAIESETITYKINKNITYKDIKMYFQDITITPLTTYLKYKCKGEKPLEILIVDDRGNALVEEMSGYGTGSLIDALFKKNRGEVNFSAVQEGVKALTLIPYYEKRRMGQSPRTEPLKYEGKLPLVLKPDAENVLTINSVERRDGKVYVAFTTEGILYDIYRYRLYLYNDQNEVLEQSIESDGFYSDESRDGILTLVFEDDPKSALYFATDTMADIEVIKDASFTIKLEP